MEVSKNSNSPAGVNLNNLNNPNEKSSTAIHPQQSIRQLQKKGTTKPITHGITCNTIQNFTQQPKKQYIRQQKSCKNQLLTFLKRQVTSIVDREKKYLKDKIALQKELQKFNQNSLGRTTNNSFVNLSLSVADQKLKTFRHNQTLDLVSRHNQYQEQKIKKDREKAQIIKRKHQQLKQNQQKHQRRMIEAHQRYEQKNLQIANALDSLRLEHSCDQQHTSRSQGSRSVKTFKSRYEQNNYTLVNSKNKTRQISSKKNITITINQNEEVIIKPVTNSNSTDPKMTSRHYHNMQNQTPTNSRVNMARTVSSRRIKLAEEENHRITNYVRRMQSAERKILQKELLNQKRRNQSIKTSVKCLVKERKQLEDKKIDQDQLRFKTRMDSFLDSQSRVKSSFIEEASTKYTLRERLREKALAKRQELREIQNQMLNGQLQQKNSRVLQKSRMGLPAHNANRDNINSRIIHSRNHFKTKVDEEKDQHERNMKLIYSKIQKIKKFGQDQNLSDQQKHQILKLLDERDPEQKQLIQFFSQSKTTYAMSRIIQEEEKAKALKMKKVKGN